MIESTHASLVLLLLVANGSPIIARKLLGTKFSRPLDHNLAFLDGKPLLGPSKTIRGVIAGTIITGAVAPAFGIPLQWGLTIGLFAMLGDLVTSFAKRRLSIEPSGMALGFDHVPEAILPLLVASARFDLHLDEILIMALIFWILAMGLSRVLFMWNIRHRPY